MDRLDTWNLCAAYSDHFKWVDYDMSSKVEDNSKSTKSGKSKGVKGGKGERKSKASSKATKISKKGAQDPQFLDEGRDMRYHVLASCIDMR